MLAAKAKAEAPDRHFDRMADRDEMTPADPKLAGACGFNATYRLC